MDKQLKIRISVISGILVLLVLGIWGYYTWNSQLSRDSYSAEKEDKGDMKELSKGSEDVVGFDMPSKEELQKYLDNLEKRNGDMLPNARYEAIQKEYGDKVADAYISGYMVSSGMTEEGKEQMLRYIRSVTDDAALLGIPRYNMENDMYADLKSSAVPLGVTEDDFFVDTKGFDVMKGWNVGYPFVTIQGMSQYVISQNEEAAVKYQNHSMVSFYAYVDEDIALDKAIKQLGKIHVEVNGVTAKPAGTLIKNWGLDHKSDLGVLPFVLAGEDTSVNGKTLIEKGMVQVVFEIENSAFISSVAAMQDNKVDQLEVTIEGKKYQLTRDIAKFTSQPYLEYSVRK